MKVPRSFRILFALDSRSGDEWFDTTKGITYKRISDDNGSHWVEI